MIGFVDENVPFELKFEYESENRLVFTATTQPMNGANYMALEYFSAPNEEIYGMGL